jgi:hypothetical protein
MAKLNDDPLTKLTETVGFEEFYDTEATIKSVQCVHKLSTKVPEGAQFNFTFTTTVLGPVIV